MTDSERRVAALQEVVFWHVVQPVLQAFGAKHGELRMRERSIAREVSDVLVKEMTVPGFAPRMTALAEGKSDV